MQGSAAQRQSAWEVATALGLIVHQEPHLLQAYIATLSVSRFLPSSRSRRCEVPARQCSPNTSDAGYKPALASPVYLAVITVIKLSQQSLARG